MNNVINLQFALEQNQNVRRAYAADPEATMRKYHLSDREMIAMRSGDESTIYHAAGMTDSCMESKLVIHIPPANKAA